MTLSLIILSSRALAIDLIGVYQQALVSDPTFQVARAQWFSDREQIAISRAGLLPHFDIEGDANYSIIHGSKLDTSDTVSDTVSDTELASETYHNKAASYTLTLQQPLFNYQAWAQLSTAKASVKSSAAIYSAAAQDLIYRTAIAYLDVLQAGDVFRYTQAEKRATASELARTRERYKVGLATITEVYQAQAQYDDVVAQEVKNRNDVAIKKEKLREITGKHYKSFARLSKKLPLISPKPTYIGQWVVRSQKQNYDLLAARYALIAAQEKIKVQRAGRYPVLKATGSFNQRYDYHLPGPLGIKINKTTYTSLIGLSLDFPVIQGGLVRAQTRQAEYDYQKAGSDLEKTDRSVVSSTRQAYLSVISGISNVKANRQAVISAKSSLQSTRESYKVGTSTMIDVLKELSSLYDKEKDYATSQYIYLGQSLALKQAAGILSVNDLRIINSWLQKTIKPISKPKQVYYKHVPKKTMIKKICNTPTAIEKQILKINPKHYAIQLMAADKEKTIINFLNTHKLPNKVYSYQTYSKGQKWYLLIMGDYPTYSHAHIALQKLPAKIRALHPWIRNYASIHETIRHWLCRP